MPCLCGEQISPTDIALWKSHVVFPTGLLLTSNILRVSVLCLILCPLSTYADEPSILFLPKAGKNLGDFPEGLPHYFT